MPETVSMVIARCLVEAGCRVVTYVPGSGATQVFDAYCALTHADLPISYHEEVAYTVAHGAGLFGSRAAALMKAHGFAKAANSIIDSLAAGTTAAVVALVFDDKRGRHSDSILDAPALVKGTGIPFRVALLHDIAGELSDAFAQSEKLGLPVALVIDADELDHETTATPVQIPPPAGVYERDVTRMVLCPIFAEYQSRVRYAKLSGVDWRLLGRPDVPLVPEGLPEAYRDIAASYATLFDVFREIRGSVVTGDTGASTFFAFPPYDCVDVRTHMGGSVALALGAYLAGFKDAWAVTGDFSYIAAGHLGVVEALSRGIPTKILILDNHHALTTRGQPISPGALDALLGGYTSYVRHISDPANRSEVETVLREAAGADSMRIVVAAVGG
ncbi:MAG: thiamine pyrophosphate-dependent enzyme [Acidobacteriota bacterium]